MKGGKNMLTAKQEQFVQNIIEGMSQAEAYRNSYSTNRMSDKTIIEEASKLMANPKIATRVNELRDRLADDSIMTAKERLKYLTRVVKGLETEKKVEWDDGKAVTCEEPASIKTRLSAIDLMNKMTGEYVQKIEGSVNVSKLEDLL
jgi:phage terminase small subunit